MMLQAGLWSLDVPCWTKEAECIPAVSKGCMCVHTFVLEEQNSCDRTSLALECSCFHAFWVLNSSASHMRRAIMKFIVPGSEIIHCCFDTFLFHCSVFSQTRNRELGVRLSALVKVRLLVTVVMIYSWRGCRTLIHFVINQNLGVRILYVHHCQNSDGQKFTVLLQGSYKKDYEDYYRLQLNSIKY